MIRIQLSKGVYRNMRLELNGFVPELVSDSYWINSYLKEKDINFHAFIKRNIQLLVSIVKSMGIGKTVYYPFDLSDQSSAFIAIKRINKKKLNVYYIYSLSLDAGNTDPVFNPDFKLADEDIGIIVGGQIFDIEKFGIDIDFQIEK